MIAEYGRVDIEAARFRKALLEDVGDPVDELTLFLASQDPKDDPGSDSHLREPIVLEGVVEVPECLLMKPDLVTGKIAAISNFAQSLGVTANFKLEERRGVIEGQHAAAEGDDPRQTQLTLPATIDVAKDEPARADR